MTMHGKRALFIVGNAEVGQKKFMLAAGVYEKCSGATVGHPFLHGWLS